MPEPVSPSPPPEDSPSRREAGFLQVVGAVFWSFFGVRRRAAGERDAVTIKLVHVVIAGLIGAALFVAVLIALVSYITRHA